MFIVNAHFSALHYLCRHGRHESTVRHEIAYKLLYAGLSADCVDHRGKVHFTVTIQCIKLGLVV